MPPKKGKRRETKEDEEMDRKESRSKWADLIEADEEEEQPDPSALYKKEKAIFNFDFSKEHLLIHQKDVPPPPPPKVELTPEEQQMLAQRREKERLEKEEKEMAKREKKAERKKLQEKEKEEERLKREEEAKEEQALEEKSVGGKGNGDSKTVFYWLLAVFVLLGCLQYQRALYVRLSKFRLSPESDHYQTLQINSAASDGQLKAQYRKLVLKYHPDKNPTCKTCPEKFQEVMTAWEVLGDPEKRKHYDQNSGFIQQLPSHSLTLTPENFQHLVGDSDVLYIVQVYDSTDRASHYFAAFWEEILPKYKGLVEFARIDVWQQSEMKSYIPFKFQIFPGLYSVHRGETKLCQLDFERPLKSIDVCIEAGVQVAVTRVNYPSQVPAKERAVILGGGVKLSTRVQLLHGKFSRYYSFYQLNDQSSTISTNDPSNTPIDYTNDRPGINKYHAFLEEQALQYKSMCEIHFTCKEQRCLLVLEGEQKGQWGYPVFRVKEGEEFSSKVEEIKRTSGLMEKFEVGIYQDGKIELGYWNEVADLNPQNGEVIDLPCVEATILRSLFKGLSTLYASVQPLFA